MRDGSDTREWVRSYYFRPLSSGAAKPTIDHVPDIILGRSTAKPSSLMCGRQAEQGRGWSSDRSDTAYQHL